jgi:hypothetical protein
LRFQHCAAWAARARAGILAFVGAMVLPLVVEFLVTKHVL